MKTLRITAAAVAALAFLAIIAGCSGTDGGGEQYGESITVAEATPLATILADPAAHAGELVRVEGEIQTECPSGCWFNIADGAAVARVDLAPHGIAIPQRVGDEVVIQGEVRVKDGQVVIYGQGVEFR